MAAKAKKTRARGDAKLDAELVLGVVDVLVLVEELELLVEVEPDLLVVVDAVEL